MKNISVFFSALVALLFSVAETSAQITPPYYNPANVRITGGTINGTTIGATTAAAGSFTALSSTKTNADNFINVNTTGSFKSGISFDNNLSGPYAKLYFDNSNNNSVFDHNYIVGNHLIKIASNTIGTFSSTGLAVTGTLSGSSAVRSGGDFTVSGAGNGLFNNTVTDGLLFIYADGTAVTGALFYGSTHATKANKIEMKAGSTVAGTFSSTALTLGTGVNIIMTGSTVAGLPAGVIGMRSYVTDALAPAFGAAVVGGGAVVIPVFYNGAAWIVG